MLAGHKVVVVLPAFNAAKTLHKTYREIPLEYVDEVLLVDDASSDSTVTEAAKLRIHHFVNSSNRGYGGNQKACYEKALSFDPDIVVMLHPDYQYSPKLIPSLTGLIASGHYDIALGSRILGGGALRGGMPLYKYVANRVLTLFQNLCLNAKLSEYHTGYRAFHVRVLQTLPLRENSDDFIFDNEFLAQAILFGFRIGEISCPTRYESDSSSINFWNSLRYGAGVLHTTLQFLCAKSGVYTPAKFSPSGRLLANKFANPR